MKESSNLIEIGKISRANAKTKVVRDGEELALSVGDALYLNDIVHNNEYDVFLDFHNGKEFFLESNQEVLLDEYFSFENENEENIKDDDTHNIQTDTIEKEAHPYYVKSHSIADVFTERNNNMVDINAKVSDSGFNANEKESIIPSGITESETIVSDPILPTQKDPYIVPTATKQETPNPTPNQVPHATPGQVPNATPDPILPTQKDPYIVPTATKQETPNPTPNQVPHATPGQVPNATPDPILPTQKDPYIVPTATKQETPNPTPNQVPHATPGQVPNATPDPILPTQKDPYIVPTATKQETPNPTPNQVPHATPGQVPNATPDPILPTQKDPYIVPTATKQETPNPTPNQVPHATPGQVPNATPDPILPTQKDPYIVPTATKQETPNPTPNQVPHATPGQVPNATPDPILPTQKDPYIVPTATKQETPNPTPNQVPHATPGQVPNATPDPILPTQKDPYIVPTATKQETPNPTPNQVPHATPGQVPNATPDPILPTQKDPYIVPTATKQETPNPTPNQVPHATPGQVPNATPDPILPTQKDPYIVPTATKQETPNPTPNQVPHATPGQVPNATPDPILPIQKDPTTVDTTPPTLSIDAISTDNVINAQEHNAPLSITGKTDAENGQTVTVSVNGTNYTGTATNGTFTLSVPANAVGAFTDGQHLNITANVTDQAGNAATPASAALDVDTSATLSIDAVSTDDIINAAEHTQALAISGTVTGVEDGQQITVTLNGHNYQVAVHGGSWTTTVPATDVTALATGSTDVTASVTDVAGNVANATHPITVTDAFAGSAATVDITDGGNTDNVINATEKTNAVVTGTIDPGSKLTTLEITDSAGTTHTVNLNPSQVTVDATGHYTVHNVDVSSLTDGQLTVSATATDPAGNLSTATDTIALDTVAFMRIAHFDSENVSTTDPDAAIVSQAHTHINASGTFDADMVMTKMQIVSSGGGIPIDVPMSALSINPHAASAAHIVASLTDFDVSSLPDGKLTLVIEGHDAAGNPLRLTSPNSIDKDTVADAGILTIEDITQDNIINAAESSGNIDIQGTAKAGAEVSFTLNGHDYQTTATSQGTWTTSVLGADLVVTPTVDVTATSHDNYGNSASVTASHTVDIDLSAQPTIDVFNALEDQNATATHGNVLTNDEAGSSIVVPIGTTGGTWDIQGLYGVYHMHVDGSFVYELDNSSKIEALGSERPFVMDIVTYTMKDAAGNTATSSLTTKITGTDDAPVITHSTDTQNLVEDTTTSASGDMGATDVDSSLLDYSVQSTVTSGGGGSVTPSAPVPGRSVGHYGTMIIDQHGHWSYQLDHTKSDSLDAGQKVQEVFTLSVTDADGMVAHEVVTINVTGTEDIPVVVGTEYLASGTEDQAPVTLHLSDLIKGDTDVDAGEGATLNIEHLHVDHGTVSGIDANGNFVYTVEPNYNGKVTFSYDVTDGHSGVDIHQTAEMDLAAMADSGIVTVQNVTNDNIINASEAGADVAVSGTATGGDIKTGDSVSFSVNGTDYTTTVGANGVWSVNVAGSDLVQDTDFDVNVVSYDGTSSVTSIGHSSHTVDTTASLSFDIISSDNMLSAIEKHQDLPISGTVTDVEDGQKVTVHLGSKDYEAVVHNGHWQTTVPAAEVTQLNDGMQSVTASVMDQSGNSAHEVSPFFVGGGSATPPITTFQTPPIVHGGGGVGSSLTGQLTPPLLLVHTSGGWGILNPDGSSSNSLQGKYGILVIDSVTGKTTYNYDTAAHVGNKGAGGQHSAGQTISEEHHDIFHIVYGGVYSNNVDVLVDVTLKYTHGRSGQNTESTQLMGMEVTNANAAEVSNDDEQTDPEYMTLQLDTDLADATQNIAAAMQEVSDLKAQGLDASAAQEKLEEFTQIKEDVKAEKEALEHPQDKEIPTSEEPHEALSLVTPEDTTQMPSLDNIEQHLEVQKDVPTLNPDVLVAAANLLGDTQALSQDDNIIKAVENQEKKEPVKNPDAPEPVPVDSADADTQVQVLEEAEFIPDVHNQMPQEDEHDGTGLTS